MQTNTVTDLAVADIVNTAKQCRSGGYPLYLQLRRQLEILPITPRQFEDAIISITKELKI